MRRPFVVLLIAIVLLPACGRDGGGSQSSGSKSLIAGTPSRLKSTLRTLRGKPVVVNYWATWCGPCKNEMPRIVAAAEKYAGRVHFLGVDVQDDVKTAADFIRRYKIPFRSLSDPDGKIRNAESLVGLPETQFYSATGELAFLHRGEIFTKELTEKIENVLSLERKADPND